VRVDVDGATVLIDGDAVGTSPLPRPVAVDLGERTVTVQKDDFVPVTRKVESSGGGTLAVTVSLVPIKHGGQLLVTSDADATVSVDGQVVGRGRFEAPLAVGAHDVRVTEPGKVPYESQVDVRDGERRTVDVTLQNQPHAAVWPWIVGGAVIAAAGATVGGYFLFKSGTQASAPATGSLSTVQLSGWGRP